MTAIWHQEEFQDRIEWTRTDIEEPRTIIAFRRQPGVFIVQEGWGMTHGEHYRLAEAQAFVEGSSPIERPTSGSLEAPSDRAPRDVKSVTDG